MKWVSDILISSHSVWHGYSVLYPGFPCLLKMLVLFIISLSPECAWDDFWLRTGSFLSIAEKLSLGFSNYSELRFFWVLTSHRWRGDTLRFPLLRDQVWYLFKFVEQIFSGCFRTFSVVCMQALPKALYLHCFFLVCLWHCSSCLAHETDTVGDLSSLVKARTVNSQLSIQAEQDFTWAETLCDIWGMTWNSFLICTRIFFHTHIYVCYTCIKVQGIFSLKLSFRAH